MGLEDTSKYAYQSETEDRRDFVIIGRHDLQNKLLAELLERRLGDRCTVASLKGTRWSHEVFNAIALLDVGMASESDIETQLGALCDEASIRAVAIFNADDHIRCERLLRWPKMQGVFYRDTSEELFVKGVQTVRNDECWLSRRLLGEYLAQTRSMQRSRVPHTVGLTRKERENLRLIAAGASNADIAKSLNISPHTVKTHVYNLYRKIKVTNRAQAVSWALKNLDQEHGDIG